MIHDATLSAEAPVGWARYERLDLYAPEGGGLFIARRPLGSNEDSKQLARADGERLARDLPRYREKSCEPRRARGRDGTVVRAYEWEVDGGTRCALTAYLASGACAYLVTASARDTIESARARLELLLAGAGVSFPGAEADSDPRPIAARPPVPEAQWADLRQQWLASSEPAAASPDLVATAEELLVLAHACGATEFPGIGWRADMRDGTQARAGALAAAARSLRARRLLVRDRGSFVPAPEFRDLLETAVATDLLVSVEVRQAAAPAETTLFAVRPELAVEIRSTNSDGIALTRMRPGDLVDRMCARARVDTSAPEIGEEAFVRVRTIFRDATGPIGTEHVLRRSASGWVRLEESSEPSQVEIPSLETELAGYLPGGTRTRENDLSQ